MWRRTNSANDLAGANFRLNAAGGLAGLSDQELNMALKQAGALGTVGDMQQQNQQARADADYEEFMRMIGYPAQQQQLRNTALGMMPQQSTTTSTSSKSMGNWRHTGCGRQRGERGVLLMASAIHFPVAEDSTALLHLLKDRRGERRSISAILGPSIRMCRGLALKPAIGWASRSRW